MTEAKQIKQRIDKWLWHARVVKTRSLAQKLVTSGKVRVDRNKISGASFQVTVGNVLTITLERQVKVLEIAGMSDRRGPFSEAQTLYKDLSPPPPVKKNKQTDEVNQPLIRNEGRPTKHQRKEAIKIKRLMQE